jgi:hypothetical protein
MSRSPIESDAFLSLARELGRVALALLDRDDRYWNSTSLSHCRSMAECLSTAYTSKAARYFARQLAKEIRSAIARSRSSWPAWPLDLVAGQAWHVAFGRQPDLPHLRQMVRHPDRHPNASPATASGDSSRAGLTHAYVEVELVPAKEAVNRWVARGYNLGHLGRRLVRLAVAVLPAAAQATYAEVYVSELWELRYTSCWRRLRHAMRLASRAWQLRRELRRVETALWAEWARSN